MEYTGGGDQNSLRGMVFNRLLDDILDGTYSPGETLVESKLAEKLGVSRTPIREAIKQLELEGLVTPLPNRRVVVQGITEKDIDDIYIIRKRLEGLAARWAVVNITEEEFEELKKTLELMEFYTQRGALDQVQELDARFHSIIFQASKSKPLRFVLANFHQFLRKARGDSLMVPGRLTKALQEHRAILDAIIASDPDAAEEAMKKHVLGARDNLVSHRKVVEK
ncbi:GntR family transcriptional regulator [Desulfitibacter alkalitolerans]|uniref:GntR family transcriptional regulator n=1 Tax=Desulfitibacter alkalitolerans TaxID=264641 RepID=UPI000485BF81|nr:GntR family transcriptional regulator [Desulfitibacter alkalitolerans]